jgi:hypothetical protein
VRRSHAAWLLFGLFAVACGSSKQPARRGERRPVKPIAFQTTPEPSAARGNRPDHYVAIDPEGERLLRERFDAPARTLGTGEVPALTRIAVEDTARAEARGLELLDGVKYVELSEGERAELSFELVQGSCATVIAHGGLGLREIDAFLIDASPTLEVRAADARKGPASVVGGQQGCFVWTEREPKQLRAVVQARRGAGTIVFAVYIAKW